MTRPSIPAGTPSRASAPDGAWDNRATKLARGVLIAGNSVSGTLAAGVKVAAGIDAGGSRNTIENVRITRNVSRPWVIGKGVFLWVGQTNDEAVPATGNRISGVTIDVNRITTGEGGSRGPGEVETAGGVVLLGGANRGRDGVIRNVRVRKDRIVTRHFGIRLIGGLGPSAQGNRVSCVRLAGNRITGTRRRVSVRSNLRRLGQPRVSARLLIRGGS